PGSGWGAGPDWVSRGRVVLSCSPPPWLVAWARKSACLRVRGDVVWVRITSSVGITGAALSTAQPTPSRSMAWTSTDNTMVALMRRFSPRAYSPGWGGTRAATVLMGTGTGLEKGRRVPGDSGP